MMYIKHKNNETEKIKSKRFYFLSLGFVLFALILYFKLNKDERKNQYKLDLNITSPLADLKSGYYTSAQELHLTCSDKDHTIYYTLDGTSPLSGTSRKYEGKILLFPGLKKDTFLYKIPTSPRWQPPIGEPFSFPVLRAVCINKDGRVGEEYNAFFIIDPEQSHKYSIPVMNFLFDPTDFFGYKNGIYVMGEEYEDKRNYIKKKIKFDIPWWKYPANYLDKGNSSERKAKIIYADLNTSCVFSQYVGVRIHGFNTRGFAQKSLRFSIIADSSNNCTGFFDGESKRNFVLRNGGNDWTKTLIRDAFVHSVMKNSTLSPQAYMPVVSFFNGEYWGVHTLRERFDEGYINDHFGIAKDSIAILELNGIVLKGKKSDSDEYMNLIHFIISNDMSKTANYEVVQQQIDIDNLITYFICNMFFVNNDWPHNNCKYWRYDYPSKDTCFRDHRWRYVLYDMDWSMGFNIDDAYKFDMFKYLKSKSMMGEVLYSLVKNSAFKKSFEIKSGQMLENELSVVSLEENIKKIRRQLSPWMPEHIDRWRVIGSFTQWNKEMDVLDFFIQNRQNVFRAQLSSFLINN